MNRTWQVQAGHLVCNWSDTGQRVVYRARWMEEAPDIPSGYLTPVPDFASHSPFCASWLTPSPLGAE